jgi:hypothetical protein
MRAPFWSLLFSGVPMVFLQIRRIRMHAFTQNTHVHPALLAGIVGRLPWWRSF